jgi:DNA-binding transcriptional MerR regulator
MKKLIREPEQAKLLGMSQRTLRSLRAQRLVPFVKINRIVLYDPDRVIAALERFERKELGV